MADADSKRVVGLERPAHIVRIVTDLDLKRAALVNYDLLPCPFCNRSVTSIVEQNTNSGNYVATILCSNCLVKMFSCQSEIELAQETVKEKWNVRSKSSGGA
jgi:transcription elongation factor Elf1